jgi:hypothetical protein
MQRTPITSRALTVPPASSSVPVPFFPHGEVLNRALYGLFEWWGEFTGTGVEVRGQATVTRAGWSLLGRALGLITNTCLYTHWQVYFDEV